MTSVTCNVSSHAYVSRVSSGIPPYNKSLVNLCGRLPCLFVLNSPCQIKKLSLWDNFKFLPVIKSWLSVADIDPPSFGSTCPSSPLITYAEREKFSALVTWTEPVATDSTGVSTTVTSNHQSPTRFSQGTHVITYTAVDQSGNKATCSFTVQVLGNNINHNRTYFHLTWKGSVFFRHQLPEVTQSDVWLKLPHKKWEKILLSFWWEIIIDKSNY